MPLLFQYILKLSCSLAVVYLFYQFTLRRLTFYTSNRWYLFGCSVLSFFISAVNISDLLERNSPQASHIVGFIPSVAQYTGKASLITDTVLPHKFNFWNVILLVLLIGMLVLFVRLMVQYFSYRKLKRSAKLVMDDDVMVYQVAKAIVPFSFGRSIFINQQLHNEVELKEIIRHEFVHIKQRHTVDIIWAELLCILNWYNPFAWLLRHALRQNLEFIADSRVIQSGIDKKHYQYMLLNVMRGPQFCIGTPFNFSSLKKRIIMINKLPTAKTHLVKFLLAVPIMFVLLVAFRNTSIRESTDQKGMNTIMISGLVANAVTHEPLSQVLIKESVSKATTLTDTRGFFSILVPAETSLIQMEITFTKQGFSEQVNNSSIKFEIGQEATSMVGIVGMIPLDSKNDITPLVNTITLCTFNTVLNTKAEYEDVLRHFEQMKKHWTTENLLHKASANSEKPYWVINGRPFIVSSGGSWASTDELTDVIFVDGKKLTGEEVNETIKRSSIKTVGTMEGEAAKKKYGFEKPVLEVYINTKPMTDAVLAPLREAESLEVDTIYLPQSYEAFKKRNPMIQILVLNQDKVDIVLKSGERETYDLKDKRSRIIAEKKYGKFPVTPPPPPPLNEELPPLMTEKPITDIEN